MKKGLHTLAGVTVTGTAAYLATRSSAKDMVWQIDPDLCIQCEKCSTNCVLSPSAVRAVRVHALCGYCNLCTAYFELEHAERSSGAENLLCPTDALKRRYIEEPYYEYHVQEELCVACARCVKGCAEFGNGSVFLQIRHHLCVGCNRCAIATDCPAQAVRRVPRAKPYLLRGARA